MTDYRSDYYWKCVHEMRALAKTSAGDPEAAHSDADDLLCKFLDHIGCIELTDAWTSVDKWYA